jgi:hypothetical protein
MQMNRSAAVIHTYIHICTYTYYILCSYTYAAEHHPYCYLALLPATILVCKIYCILVCTYYNYRSGALNSFVHPQNYLGWAKGFKTKETQNSNFGWAILMFRLLLLSLFSLKIKLTYHNRDLKVVLILKNKRHLIQSFEDGIFKEFSCQASNFIFIWHLNFWLLTFRIFNGMDQIIYSFYRSEICKFKSISIRPTQLQDYFLLKIRKIGPDCVFNFPIFFCSPYSKPVKKEIRLQ